MSTLAQIIKAAEGLPPGEFLRLRQALDQVEEGLWQRELARVAAKQRKGNLTDAKIDELVLKRRSRGRQA